MVRDRSAGSIPCANWSVFPRFCGASRAWVQHEAAIGWAGVTRVCVAAETYHQQHRGFPAPAPRARPGPAGLWGGFGDHAVGHGDPVLRNSQLPGVCAQPLALWPSSTVSRHCRVLYLTQGFVLVTGVSFGKMDNVHIVHLIFSACFIGFVHEPTWCDLAFLNTILLMILSDHGL